MGGDAFPDTERLDRAALDETLAVVVEVLEAFPRVRYRMPPELTEKESFGDLDLLLCIDDADADDTQDEAARRRDRAMLQDAVVRALATRLECMDQIGHAHLLTARRFQVDLEFLAADSFDMAAAVFSHGDFAWLLGLSLREHGLKLTESGMFARREAFAPPLHADVLLSRDPAQVCAFLRLPDGFMDGRTQRSSAAVFDAVARARCFSNKHFHAYEATDTCETRRRNRKRPMLTQFQQWLASPAALAAEADAAQAHNTAASAGEPELAQAVTFFAREDEVAAATEVARAEERERQLRKRVSLRVNGKRVLARHPELPGKQVGAALQIVRQEHGGESLVEFAQWTATASDADIDDALNSAVSQLKL